MKRSTQQFLLIVALLCFTSSLFSQKLSSRKLRRHYAKVLESKRSATTIWSLDTIFKKGLPYAIFIRQKNLPYHIYALFSLHRQLLATIHTEVVYRNGEVFYYSFRFTKSEKIAEPEKYKFDLVQKIVEFDLVQGETINPISEIKFLKAFPRQFSDSGYVKTIDGPILPETDIYALVRRDSSSSIYLDKTSIYQDLKPIGYYKNQEDLLRFYLPSGIMAAQASRLEGEAAGWNIESLKDKKMWRLIPSTSNEVLEIITFLVKRKYL